MECGWNPNSRNWVGTALMHRCAKKGRIEIASVALEFGADINIIETEYSSTPLGWAAREGKTDMVKWLLEKGANPNLPADEPWALPIAWATRRGHTEIIEMLK
jgi:ankyrin repeat protein